MKKLGLALWVVASLAWTGFSGEVTKQSIVQFRLVVPQGTADSEKIMADGVPGHGKKEELHVSKTPLMDGSAVKSAGVIKNNLGFAEITIDLTKTGAEQFAKVTREHIKERLAIFIDGRFISAPTIQSEISGGKAQISGAFSPQEAAALAKKINDAVKK
jgi:preprotein translocase subunit SecD